MAVCMVSADNRAAGSGSERKPDADLVMFITYLRSIVYAIGYLRMAEDASGSVGKIHVPYGRTGIQTVNVFLCRRCSIPADLQCNGRQILR